MFRFIRLGVSRSGWLIATAVVSALVSAGVVTATGLAGADHFTTTRARTVNVVDYVFPTEVVGDTVDVAPGGTGVSSAYCPQEALHVVGGGLEAHGTHGVSVMSVVGSSSTNRMGGWQVRVVNPTGALGAVSFHAIAICIGVTKTPVLAG
jgi:hypothetical protein